MYYDNVIILYFAPAGGVREDHCPEAAILRIGYLVPGMSYRIRTVCIVPSDSILGVPQGGVREDHRQEAAFRLVGLEPPGAPAPY